MGTNSGTGSNKNPALTKRGRFNANPTACHGHPGCMIKKQSDIDKKKYQNTERTVISRGD